MLTRAIYRYHPRFANASFEFWYGDTDEDPGLAALEGGDIMPVGNGAVLVGMGERTTWQGVSRLASNLFKAGAAEKVIIAAMAPDRASMHLDTVFTFLDADKATAYPRVVDTIRPLILRPADDQKKLELESPDKHFVTVVEEALGLDKLHIVETGGNFMPRRVSSGMTPTTWLPWSPVWSWLTIAINTPMPSFATLASKSSRSVPPSSAVVAVADTA